MELKNVMDGEWSKADSAFNRTAYGIEKQMVFQILLPNTSLLIAPLMELKIR